MGNKSAFNSRGISSPRSPQSRAPDIKKAVHIKVRLSAKSVSADSLKHVKSNPLANLSTYNSLRIPNLASLSGKKFLINNPAPGDFIEPTHDMIIPSIFEYASFSKHLTNISIHVVDKPHLRRRNTTEGRKVKDYSKGLCGYLRN
jgi:hypothetical protein